MHQAISSFVLGFPFHIHAPFPSPIGGSPDPTRGLPRSPGHGTQLLPVTISTCGPTEVLPHLPMAGGSSWRESPSTGGTKRTMLRESTKLHSYAASQTLWPHRSCYIQHGS